MSAHLGEKASIVRAEVMRDEHFREGLDLVVFGFELIDAWGNVLQPRHLADRFRLLKKARDEFRLVAVGESWKILADAEERPLRSRFAKLPAGEIDCLVTDEATYSGDRLHGPGEIERPDRERQ